MNEDMHSFVHLNYCAVKFTRIPILADVNLGRLPRNVC